MASRGASRRLARLMVVSILAVFYGMLAGQLSASELVGGLLTTVLGALYALAAHRLAGRRLRFAAPWLRLVGRPLSLLAIDSYCVGWVLLQAVWRRPETAADEVVVQPFRPGGDDPEDAGRRGLVTLGISFAPNTYVIGPARPGGGLLLHRLHSSVLSPDIEWPL